MQENEANNIITPNQHISELSILAEKIVNKYTVPIIIRLDGGKYLSDGTGILLRIGDGYFVISAAHVLRPSTMDTFIFSGEQLTLLEGIINSTSPQHLIGTNNDKFDFAYSQIKGALAQGIEKGKQFLNTSGMNSMHNPQKSFRYFFVGYPSSKVKIYKDYSPNVEYLKVKKMEVFGCACLESHNETYTKIGITKGNHILVDFDRSNLRKGNSTEFIKQCPALKGMSGCGLWHLVTPLLHDIKNPQFKLVGIFNSYDTENKVMIFTSIRYVIEWIKNDIEKYQFT